MTLRILFILILSILPIQAQRFVKSANTIAEMVAFNVKDVHTNVFVANYSTTNDGGGGLFTYDANSLFATNLGTVFASTTVTGRWLRAYSGPVHVTWFGSAVNNGVTQAYGPITNAIATYNDVYFPPGTYKITNSIIITGRSRLRGAGYLEDETASGPSVILKTGSFVGLILNGGATIVEGLTIKGDSGNGTNGIHVIGPQVVLRDVTSINHGGHGIRIGNDDSTKSYNANMWRLDNVVVRSNIFHGLLVSDDAASGGPNANAGVANGVFAFNNSGDGVRVDKAEVNTFMGLNCETNIGIGLRVQDDAAYNTFFNPHAELNAGGNITLEASSLNNLLLTSDNSTPVNSGNNVVLRNAGGVNQAMMVDKDLLVGGTTDRRQLATVLGVEGATPGTYLWNTAASADNRLWSWILSSGTLSLRAASDDLLTENTALSFTRSGATVSAITATPAFVANGDLTLGSTFTFPNPTSLTIATGAITVTQQRHRVDTQNGDPSDDLDTVNGGSQSRYVMISPVSDARTIVVKHNTGNILCVGNADITLDDAQDYVWLVFDGTLNKWMAK